MVNALVGAIAGGLVSPLIWTLVLRSSRRPWPHRTPAAATVMAGCVVLGGWAGGWAGGVQPPVAWWALLVTGVGLAVVDVREHRLPNPLVAAAAAGVAAGLAVAAVDAGRWAPICQGAGAGACVFAVFYVVALFSGMGFGDVKLAAVVAGCAGADGPAAAVTALLAGFAVAGAVAVARLVGGAGRGSAVALGPWLLLGAAAVLPWLSSV